MTGDRHRAGSRAPVRAEPGRTWVHHVVPVMRETDPTVTTTSEEVGG
jgi:hypothetical protein